jgi:hypothetical protein
MCCSGCNCDKVYEVVSDVYINNDMEEVYDIKGANGVIETAYVEYLDEYLEY